MVIATEKTASHWFKTAIPQVLTATRIIFGAAGIICVRNGHYHLAASLITLGAVTDVLDGLVARKLGTASPFGALFDTFTDYLCFVVAPWLLTRALVGADGNIVVEILVGLPLLTAALRYARNSLIIATQTEKVFELPGLATVFFAFLPVAATFLDAGSVIGETRLTLVLTSLVAVFSVLMITAIRYPKLTRFRGLTIPVTILLIAMPFIGTQILALIMLITGLFYVGIGPFVASQRASQK